MVHQEVSLACQRYAAGSSRSRSTPQWCAEQKQLTEFEFLFNKELGQVLGC